MLCKVITKHPKPASIHQSCPISHALTVHITVAQMKWMTQSIWHTSGHCYDWPLLNYPWPHFTIINSRRTIASPYTTHHHPWLYCTTTINQWTCEWSIMPISWPYYGTRFLSMTCSCFTCCIVHVFAHVRCLNHPYSDSAPHYQSIIHDCYIIYNSHIFTQCYKNWDAMYFEIDLSVLWDSRPRYVFMFNLLYNLCLDSCSLRLLSVCLPPLIFSFNLMSSHASCLNVCLDAMM
jgi:hypothetical protein